MPLFWHVCVFVSLKLHDQTIQLIIFTFRWYTGGLVVIYWSMKPGTAQKPSTVWRLGALSGNWNAFNKVFRWTCAHHQYFMGKSKLLLEPLHLFITGGAGTSKNHLISVNKEHIERSHTGSQNACLLVVPTGVAAFSVKGLMYSDFQQNIVTFTTQKH